MRHSGASPNKRPRSDWAGAGIWIALLWLVASVPVRAGYVPITDFAKTGNAQANLQSSFPAGLYTSTNSFATPFNITTNASGKNYSEIVGAGSTLVISNLNLPSVAEVFTLMNAYSPVAGPLASVEFIGSAGADQTFTLVGGVELRDFFQGSWEDTINGVTAQTAYQTNSVQGAAGTGNTQTGLTGTYRLDEQKFTLTNTFLGQYLRTIKITNLNGNSTPFVVGITAEVTAPLLSIWRAGANSVVVAWPALPGGWTLQRNPSLATANWEAVTNAPSVFDGVNRVVITPLETTGFFRLSSP